MRAIGQSVVVTVAVVSLERAVEDDLILVDAERVGDHDRRRVDFGAIVHGLVVAAALVGAGGADADSLGSSTT